MTSENRSGPDLGLPGEEFLTTQVDDATWSQIALGARVVGSDGHEIGEVKEVESRTLSVEARRSLLQSEEVFVPHTAVARVDDNRVYLSWDREQLARANEHYRAFHFRQRQT